MRKKRLVLDRQGMIDMLRDPGFYEKCEAFNYLRDTALASWAMYQRDREAGICKTCVGTQFRYMRGVLDAFRTKMIELQEAADTTTLRTVKTYLEGRKRYQATEVVIYYRWSRKQGPIWKFTIR